jgi:hypothetical protein
MAAGALCASIVLRRLAKFAILDHGCILGSCVGSAYTGGQPWTLTPRAAGGLCVTVRLPAAPPHFGEGRPLDALTT